MKVQSICLPNRWIVVSLTFGVCVRLGLLWTDHQAADGLKFGQDEKRGDKTSVVFVDDPKALVVLGPGPDGLPGPAGIDDGGNGTTDERTELGATGSDDVCRVMFGAEADSLRERLRQGQAWFSVSRSEMHFAESALGRKVCRKEH